MRAQELVEGPWLQQNLDPGAALIIPVPAPLGGAIVVRLLHFWGF
jgi:DNA damage-binding protein 1